MMWNLLPRQLIEPQAKEYIKTKRVKPEIQVLFQRLAQARKLKKLKTEEQSSR